jgi:hypothetical protein
MGFTWNQKYYLKEIVVKLIYILELNKNDFVTKLMASNASILLC